MQVVFQQYPNKSDIRYLISTELSHMTPDERLDQLEPLLAETMAILDQHTALHRQTQAQIKQVIGLVGQQSSNISFLLTGQAALQTTVADMQTGMIAMRQDIVQLKQGQVELWTEVAGIKTEVSGIKTDVAGIKTDVAGIKTEVAGIKTEVAGIKTDVADLKTDVAGIKTELSGVGGKIDLILQVLQNSNK
ncbi:hypothetical protein [Hymenobacter cavernae]|uniref:Uncharacterized protein n=1 Tax=Hymenobacter cavernae TaxID=2044852 RepID=A0ABQ1TNR3_9BACT|nr:hypothetical protein [Hymenobacter cavernae]GGE98725.1 hypothetical protein GCM10011383_06930 [Hymenobacter cavernae]